MLALVSTYRYDGDDVNMELARSEAKILHEAVRSGGTTTTTTTAHEELIRVVGTRSKAQLNATFSCFRDEHEHHSSIAKALPHGGDHADYLRALRTAVRCIADASKYFAKVSCSSMAPLYNQLTDNNVTETAFQAPDFSSSKISENKFARPTNN